MDNMNVSKPIISFKKITKKNYKKAIELSGGLNSEDHCAPNYVTILDSIYDNKPDGLRAIYLDDKLIGIFYYYIFNNAYWVNRLMIDKKYQNKGYGKMSFIKLMKYLEKKRNKDNVNRIEFSVSNPILLKLDNKMGFVKMNNDRSDKFYKEHKEHIFYKYF